MAEYFADDEPMAVSSRRVRRSLKKNDKNDPASTFGNTRGVPVPEWYQEDVLEVGGLRFKLEKIHIHMSGDYAIFLDKHDEANAAEGVRGGGTLWMFWGTSKCSNFRWPTLYMASFFSRCCASLNHVVCVRSENIAFFSPADRNATLALWWC